MKLNITPNTMTSDVKSEFSECFDGLKIEFFKHHHEHQEGSPKKDILDEHIPLSEINPNIAEQELEINTDMSVNAVEDKFESLGLHIQVFRKMNLSWIETTATDSYTLEQQINLSRESRGLNT